MHLKLLRKRVTALMRPLVAVALLFTAALCIALWQLVVAPLRDPNHLRLPPQQQVITKVPILGVHTRLTDEVEQSKIQRTFEMVRQMGASWDVEYFPWNYIQGNSSRDWSWSHPDLLINHAQRQGLQVIARLDSTPVWARPKDTNETYLDPSHYADFGNYVYEFVRRYHGQVAAYVIWNEPNLAYEWGYRAPDPEAYAALLKVAYASAKAADPRAVVLAAPLAPTNENDGLAMDDVVFLQRLYAAGGGAAFDGLAVHTYGWRNAPAQPPNEDEVNFRRVELLRQVMVSQGDPDKKIYVTETGWNDYPRWIRAVSPSQQLEYSVQAVQLAETLALAGRALLLGIPAAIHHPHLQRCLEPRPQ